MRIKWENDLSEIEALDCLIFSHDELGFQKNNTEWCCMVLNGERIAFGGIRRLSTGLAILEKAGVLPAFRGSGIHRKLILARLKWAKRHHIKKVITYTAYNNTSSNNSLISCGFKMYQPDWAWVGREHFIYWYKDL